DARAWGGVAAGLVAAAVAATAAEIVRSPDLVRFPLDPRWLRGLAGLPWQVLRDTWLLTAALWRHCSGRPVHGSFRVVPFPSEADAARSAARRGLARAARPAPRRALVTAAASVAPNTVVVGIEGGRGEMLVHQLVPEPGSPVP